MAQLKENSTVGGKVIETVEGSQAKADRKLNKIGDTMTGDLTITDGHNIKLDMPSTTEGWVRGIHYYSNDGMTRVGGIGFEGYADSLDTVYMGWGTKPYLIGNSLRVGALEFEYRGYTVWHSGNSNFLSKNGGTMTGDLVLSNNTLSASTITFDGSTSIGLRLKNDNGYISLTPLNSNWAHIYTDRSKFIFNQPVYTTADTFSSYDADLKLQRSGSTKLTLGTDTHTFDSGKNTTVNIVSDDNGESALNLIGTNQGTGVVYVGQSHTFGGGMYYNGDGFPIFSEEITDADTPQDISDRVALFRRYAGGNHVVASWAYDSDTISFTSTPTVNGHKIWHSGNDGKASGLNADQVDGYSALVATAGNTIPVRNSSGDLCARLFRSEYTNSTTKCNYFMGQVDTGSNNYVRPMSKSTARASLEVARTRVYGGKLQYYDGSWKDVFPSMKLKRINEGIRYDTPLTTLVNVNTDCEFYFVKINATSSSAGTSIYIKVEMDGNLVIAESAHFDDREEACLTPTGLCRKNSSVSNPSLGGIKGKSLKITAEGTGGSNAASVTCYYSVAE